jgi:hypothetical protein
LHVDDACAGSLGVYKVHPDIVRLLLNCGETRKFRAGPRSSAIVHRTVTRTFD